MLGGGDVLILLRHRDPSSVEAFKDDPVSKKFMSEDLKYTENTQKLSEFVGKSGDFAALFYVGGHGRA